MTNLQLGPRHTYMVEMMVTFSDGKINTGHMSACGTSEEDVTENIQTELESFWVDNGEEPPKIDNIIVYSIEFIHYGTPNQVAASKSAQLDMFADILDAAEEARQ